MDGLLLTEREGYDDEVVEGAGPGAASGAFISPTGAQLASLNHAFKEGAISREEKEHGKLQLLAASTD